MKRKVIVALAMVTLFGVISCNTGRKSDKNNKERTEKEINNEQKASAPTMLLNMLYDEMMYDFKTEYLLYIYGNYDNTSYGRYKESIDYRLYDGIRYIYQNELFEKKNGFKHYNPEFVNWLTSEIETISKNNTAKTQIQNIYNNTDIGETARTLYETLEELKKNDIDKITDNYKNTFIVNESEQDLDNAIDWNNMQVNGLRGTINTNEDVATAFWLRRNIDGTIDEFSNLLNTILKIYDPGYKPEIE